MIINMVGGGGGAALNFKVVPGLTQPGTASENTIWVKTERIGAWYFSATQPEGLQEWDVWFPTGTASEVEFNAIKKNAVQVYPLSAKQLVSGALVDVTAKSYHNGEWVSLEKTLMPPSTGWSFTKIFSNTTLGSCSFDGDVFVGSYSEASRGAGIIKSIDFTNYKTIEVYYDLKNKDTESSTSPGYGGVIIMVTDYDLNSNSNEIAAKWSTNSDNNIGKVSIDVSGITDVHKFVAGIRGYSGTDRNNEIRITKIKGVE